MSELQKKISRIQRREGPRMGFSQAVREQPRAMLLGAFAENGEAALAAHAAGADVIIFSGADVEAVATHALRLKDSKITFGARLGTLGEAGAASLVDQGCDFVISSLGGTAAAAVDTDRMGHVVEADSSMDDSTLRSLAPLGLDALYVHHTNDEMSLGQQLELVRIASFASTPLFVSAPANTGVSDLRVLRDSGCAVVVLPSSATASDITAFGERLQAVPAPRKGKRESGRDIAIVPTSAAGSHEHEGDDDDGDE